MVLGVAPSSRPPRVWASFFSLDPCRSRVQPSLHILGAPLGLTLVQPFSVWPSTALSLSDVASCPCGRGFTADSVLFAPLPLPPGAHRGNPCVCRAFIRPILTCASPGWFPFSSPARIASVGGMHGSLSSGHLSSNSSASCRSASASTVSRPRSPVPFLLWAGPPSASHLSYGLSCELLHVSGRARGDPSPDHVASPLACISPVGRWSSALLGPPGLPRLVARSRSASHPRALTAAASHLSTLSRGDVSAWAGGSVPGGLGQGGAGMHIGCAGCVAAASLSFSTGLWAASCGAEAFALLRALGWCVSRSGTCGFDSIAFFSDSLSVLSALSAPLPCLTPGSLSSAQSLLGSLSRSGVVRLRWNLVNLADSLAGAGASLDPSKKKSPEELKGTHDWSKFRNEPQRLPCTRPSASGHFRPHLDLWSRPWGVARLLGFRGIDPRPHP